MKPTLIIVGAVAAIALWFAALPARAQRTQVISAPVGVQERDEVLQHEFFGPARTAGFKKTPLGIPWNAQGLDNTVSENKIRKGIGWLKNRGASEALQKEFAEYARVLPEHIPGWIDAGFLDARAKGLACGGRYAEMARKIRPGDLTVVIRAGGFRVQGRTDVVAGHADWGGIIYLSVLTVNKLKSDPPNAYFQTIANLSPFEIGNYFWHIRMKLPYTSDASSEIGNQSPCKLQLPPKVIEQ